MKYFFDLITPEIFEVFFKDHPLSRSLFYFIVVALSAFVLTFVARKIVDVVIKFIISKTKISWDNIFFRHGVFSKFVNMVPALIFYTAASSFENGGLWLKKLSFCIIIIVSMDIIRATCKALLDIYDSLEISKDRPLKGLVQIVLIAVYCIGIIAVVSVLLDKSPALLISGLGAMTAVIMLIFRDTILGFVAGIQIAANNSIRKGDWIAMPHYNADGVVIDIALHVIKIQNWDNTIVSIPTHRFLEEGFTNWRGMLESGGRRISRNIMIDLSSIRFLTDEEIEEISKIEIMRSYIASKKEEISKWNSSTGDSAVLNKRHLTNIGTFREYAYQYVLHNDKLRQDLTLMVRQMPQSEHGIALQVYAFTKTTEWTKYEAVQGDIFDHLLSAVTFFGLRLYQQPSWHDFQVLNENFRNNINAADKKTDKNS